MMGVNGRIKCAEVWCERGGVRWEDIVGREEGREGQVIGSRRGVGIGDGGGVNLNV